MKKFVSLLLVVAVTATMFGCKAQNLPAPSAASSQGGDSLQEPVAEKPMPEIIPAEDADENGGADAYANAGDNPKSRFYINPDFYNMKSDGQTTIIPNYKTMQQTTEWSCGNVAALMTMYNMSKTDVSEMEIAKAMGSSTDLDTPGAGPGSADNFFEYGTNLEQMYKYFSAQKDFKIVQTNYKEVYTDADLLSEADGVTPSKYGNLKPTFSAMSLYTSDNSDDSENYVDDAKDSYFVKWLLENINAKRPIMVEWVDWSGHWVNIIGYDNNGTPAIGDDVLIFADPYDTSDHWQDGYAYYPLERFFYMWHDTSVAQKPLQVQPFIIVEKAS